MVGPDTDALGAERVAVAIVDAVGDLAIPHRGSSTSDHVTVSVGVATIAPAPGDDGGWARLLQQADGCLYQAKSEGRNRIRTIIAPAPCDDSPTS